MSRGSPLNIASTYLRSDAFIKPFLILIACFIHVGSAAAVAIDWLKWQLNGDEAAAQTFVGPDCALCADPVWTVQRKGFD